MILLDENRVKIRFDSCHQSGSIKDGKTCGKKIVREELRCNGKNLSVIIHATAKTLLLYSYDFPNREPPFVCI